MDDSSRRSWKSYRKSDKYSTIRKGFITKHATVVRLTWSRFLQFQLLAVIHPVQSSMTLQMMYYQKSLLAEHFVTKPTSHTLCYHFSTTSPLIITERRINAHCDGIHLSKFLALLRWRQKDCREFQPGRAIQIVMDSENHKDERIQYNTEDILGYSHLQNINNSALL